MGYIGVNLWMISLCLLVREWRKTWHLNSRFLYTDMDKLLEDIKHDYEHVRTGALQAITVAIINENIMRNKSIQAKGNITLPSLLLIFFPCLSYFIRTILILNSHTSSYLHETTNTTIW